MAELNVQTRGKRKNLTPRIDLTPMVDLGFLLTTFFMYTTTMAKPNVMSLTAPDNKKVDNPPAIPDTSTITLIPTRQHMVAYYEGFLQAGEKMRMCTITGLRDILLKKKSVVRNLSSSYSPMAHKMYVLIKPDENCKYSDIVDLLDEMNIDDVANYTVMDITPEEKEALRKKF